MTQDEIIEFIKRSGLNMLLEVGGMDKCLEHFAKLVAQHEREECAKVCDDINAKYKWPDDVAERIASQWCADAIRARGNQ